jgi:hypothetical protein
MLALANMVTSRNPSNILSISDLSPSRRAKLPKSQQDEDGVCVSNLGMVHARCKLQAAADQI